MAMLDSIQSVADVIQKLPTSGHLIVGIVGPPGAGKSTIAASLVELLPDAALLPMDGFHLPQAELRRLGRRERMGAPDTFDVDGFLLLLTALRRGEAVDAPDFDRDIEEPIPGTLHIDAPIVVVEGNYLLHWAGAAPLFDATFYVELPDDIRLERLIARHERFGKSPVDARAWALGPDEANARIIAATARHADHRIRLAK